jgi:TPR repeat protein
MFRIFVLFVLFLNIDLSANAQNQENILKKKYDEYDNCLYLKSKRKNNLAVEFDLEQYLPFYNSNLKKVTLECNKIFEKFINDDEFINITNAAVKKNESRYKNIYLKIFLRYHQNIIWNSENIDTIEKSLDIIENNYLANSNLDINGSAVGIIGSLGWFYNTKIGFFNFKKSLNYFEQAIKYEKDEYSLKYYINNLGVIYDQDRSNNFSRKINNQKAYELYTQAADMGLHYSYGNLAKFYILGLGGVGQNYNKAIKNLKLARNATFGDNDFTDLTILYSKKRLPKNITEYISWIEEYTISNQDSHGFQRLAWLLDDDEKEFEVNLIQKKIYKWQYLCSKFCTSYSDKERALSEMHVIKKLYLNDKDVKKSINEAKKWEDVYWNKPIKKEKKIPYKKNKELVDLIKNTIIKN